MSFKEKWLQGVESTDTLHYNNYSLLLSFSLLFLSLFLAFRNYQDLLSQAKTWENSGEYSRAVSTYLLLTVQNCDNQDILIQSWNKVIHYTKDCNVTVALVVQ